MIKVEKILKNQRASEFCEQFVNSSRPKYILGRNKFAESIAKVIDVDGFIDDFTTDVIYLDRPITPINQVPNNALVVTAIIGKPLQAEKRVRQFQFDAVDYFSFYKYAELPIEEIMFWGGFSRDFEQNRDKYEWIYKLLNDNISQNQFYNIVNFRLSYDLTFMRGFCACEERQYFEKFLSLSSSESFVDIGGFDGFTTEEFIKRVTAYRAVYFFEPEVKNLDAAKRRLTGFKNIKYFKKGLFNSKCTLNFSASQSTSMICANGDCVIEVDCLDNMIDEPITFIKMDIEGAEKNAISGAERLIKKYHPKLAISVYHKSNDLWKIPEQILGIRDDYLIYLRHYTEGISETVMFFIPVT